MENVIKVLEQIKNTSSLNDKKSIITENKNNELFKKCLVFLLDGNIQTGLSEKKISKNVAATNAITIPTDCETMMEYLKENNSGRDSDISLVQAFINKQPIEYKEFYTEFFTKKYKIGCDAKVVNKCIPGLIPTFDVMLGTPIEKCNLNSDETIFISRKLNGVRCCFVGDKLMSRQGKQYQGVDHIINDLQILVGKDMFIDGELLYKNEEGLSDSEAFQKGTGIAMSKDTDKSELKLVVFDMFPLEEFWDGKSKNKYSIRRNDLISLKDKIELLGTENIEVVQMVYHGNNHSEIWNWLEYSESVDWEGLILNLDTPYECKRTKNLIKVKKFYDTTLRIVDIEEGTGRNKNKLGALVCKYKDNTVKCGSGFSDEQRDEIWKNKNDYIGCLVDVKYKEITKDKNTGLESLQFPVFMGFRYDKTNADDE